MGEKGTALDGLGQPLPAPVTFERSNPAAGRTLVIHGEIDMAVAVELDLELATLIAEARAPVFVDLSEVTFMDATGVNALLNASRAGAARGAPLVLVAASRPCRRVLEICGVWDRLQAGSSPSRSPAAGGSTQA